MKLIVHDTHNFSENEKRLANAIVNQQRELQLNVYQVKRLTQMLTTLLEITQRLVVRVDDMDEGKHIDDIISSFSGTKQHSNPPIEASVAASTSDIEAIADEVLHETVQACQRLLPGCIVEIDSEQAPIRSSRLET